MKIKLKYIVFGIIFLLISFNVNADIVYKTANNASDVKLFLENTTLVHIYISLTGDISNWTLPTPIRPQNYFKTLDCHGYTITNVKTITSDMNHPASYFELKNCVVNDSNFYNSYSGDGELRFENVLFDGRDKTAIAIQAYKEIVKLKNTQIVNYAVGIKACSYPSCLEDVYLENSNICGNNADLIWVNNTFSINSYCSGTCNYVCSELDCDNGTFWNGSVCVEVDNCTSTKKEYDGDFKGKIYRARNNIIYHSYFTKNVAVRESNLNTWVLGSNHSQKLYFDYTSNEWKPLYLWKVQYSWLFPYIVPKKLYYADAIVGSQGQQLSDSDYRKRVKVINNSDCLIYDVNRSYNFRPCTDWFSKYIYMEWCTIYEDVYEAIRDISNDSLGHNFTKLANDTYQGNHSFKPNNETTEPNFTAEEGIIDKGTGEVVHNITYACTFYGGLWHCDKPYNLTGLNKSREYIANFIYYGIDVNGDIARRFTSSGKLSYNPYETEWFYDDGINPPVNLANGSITSYVGEGIYERFDAGAQLPEAAIEEPLEFPIEAILIIVLFVLALYFLYRVLTR